MPQAIAGAVFGATNAAYQAWLDNPRSKLGPTLDAALAALATGFDPSTTTRRPARRSQKRR
jgi:MftR C-terminal domain